MLRASLAVLLAIATGYVWRVTGEQRELAWRTLPTEVERVPSTRLVRSGRTRCLNVRRAVEDFFAPPSDAMHDRAVYVKGPTNGHRECLCWAGR